MFHQNLLQKFNKICKLSQRSTSFWSPLAEAFNSRPINNYYIKKEVGLFNVPALTSHEGFFELQSMCTARTDELIKEATSPHRKRKMVEIFDELSDTLCQVADLAEFIRLAHPDAEYSRAAESACCSISGIVEKLNTNITLYKTLKEAVVKKDIAEMNEVDKLVGELFLFDFEQCGIHLSDAERERVVALNDSILNIGQQFVAGSSTPRLVKKSSIPENVRNVFSSAGEHILVSGLYTDSPNPLAREMAFRIFLHPDKKQDYLLSNLLMCRHELARVCGFNTYAERALRGATVDQPADVMEFLNNLSKDIAEKAAGDFQIMSSMKMSESPGCGPLAAWDVPYYTQKVKKHLFRVTSQEYSPYLSLGACMHGLDQLFESLYGINLVNTEIRAGECWHPEVYKLSVIHKDEGLLGYIYCDFFEREGKPNQDCHFTIKGGRQLPDGSYQTPIVVLMLNLPTPRWGSPALLTPGLVDNLFHEMGHAMHSMLARTKYQHITGTRCSTDFAEVPSVLMEYFASDIRVLKMFARHFQTNQPMSDDMLYRLCASKNLFTASETQLQLFYAALDQVYHGPHPLSGTTTEVLAETQGKYYGLPYVPNTTWQLRFSHLVGYGAKYYSYLVSRALAQLIWQTYFKDDPFNSTNGQKYRNECLSYGGGKNPKKLVADFLQFQPTPIVLANSIVKEVELSQEIIDRAMKTTKKV